MIPVMRKPEMTKKTSTPIKPPGMTWGNAWYINTEIIATALSPSTYGL